MKPEPQALFRKLLKYILRWTKEDSNLLKMRDWELKNHNTVTAIEESSMLLNVVKCRINIYRTLKSIN